MRFVVAMMQHETNTFSALPTPLAAFAAGSDNDQPLHGQDAIDFYDHTNFAFAAFLDAARGLSAEIVVPIAAYAEPSGPVAADAFEVIAARICTVASEGCDAIFLDLHGAMVTETYDDGEGELLRRIRAIAPSTPIAVALDFHANLTSAIVDNADVVTGYRTYPHIDMYETGERAARTLLAYINGGSRPLSKWNCAPLITNMVCQGTSQPPMQDIMNEAIQFEQQGEVLNASVFGGFPLADIPRPVVSVVVVGASGASEPRYCLDSLLEHAWSRREAFMFKGESVVNSISHAKTLGDGPIVLADHGDNSGAGGSQDDMTVVAEIIKQGLEDVAVGPIWDPIAVEQLMQTGINERATVMIGGRTDTPALGLKGAPLELEGVVRNITNGCFTLSGPMMTGCQIDLGRTVVFATGNLLLMVSEKRCEPYDQEFFRHAGIEPTKKKFLSIKSRHHFRASFESIARHIVIVAGPGVCSEKLHNFPYKKLRRPVFPLDPDIQWISSETN